MRTRIVVLVVVVLAGLLVAAPAVAYLAPVDAPIAEGFDTSAGSYGPGNRGLDYEVDAGADVHASNEGTVVFAGSVAGNLWVTIAHPDGLRTSYGPLADLAVQVGQRVATAQVIGSAEQTLHFGVRRGDTYIDPSALLAGVRLLPLRDPQDLD